MIKTTKYLLEKIIFKRILVNSIDYEIMEKSKNLKAILLNCNWSDVGSWDAIANIKKSDKSRKILSISSKNNFFNISNRLIATIDIDNCIIIDTPDATLISKKGSSHKVHEIVDKIDKDSIQLKENHLFEIRPWGSFETLLENKIVKLKS